MIVDIDAGNTRIKWRAFRGGELLVGGTGVLAEVDLLDSIEQAIAASGPYSAIQRVRIASVRDAERLNGLTARIQDRWQVTAEFAVTTTYAGGVRNSYSQPETMGVDRWCGIVAAAHLPSVSLNSSPFCVIDAGSAITIDFVDQQGVHQGGHIAPGFAMQLQSLLGGTDRVFVDSSLLKQSLKPANNTSDAVLSGVLLNMTALIEQALHSFAQQMPSGIQVIITGGDAELLTAHLSIDMQHSPDLVLDGLGLLLS